MLYVANLVTQKKYYGSSQPDWGEEPTPPDKYFHINNPEDIPHTPKGFLKHLEQDSNARASQHYSIVEGLGQNPCVMSSLEVI